MTDNADEKSEDLRDMVEGRLDDLFQADDEDSSKKPKDLQDIVAGRLDDLFPADDEDDSEKPEGLQDVVESRLDNLFPEDDEDDREKPEELQDVVESRLDNLFPENNEDDREKPEELQDVVDSRLDNLFPEDDEDTEPQSDYLRAEVENRLDDLSAEDLEIDYDLVDSEEAPGIDKAVSSYKSTADKTKIEAATKLTDQQEEQTVSPTKEPEKATAPDSKNTSVQLSKETTRPGDDNNTESTGKKPTDKTTIGISPEDKPQISGALVASGVDNKTLPKTSQGAVNAKQIVSPKVDPKLKKSSRGLLKLILGGLFIIGCVLALVFFSNPPEPRDQSQPVAALKTHKIENLPARTAETEPAPTVTPPPYRSRLQPPSASQNIALKKRKKPHNWRRLARLQLMRQNPHRRVPL